VDSPAKKFFSGLFRMRGRKSSVVLLQWANWILLGVSWGVTLQAYLRLPGRMVLWHSVWREVPVVVDRSWLFFAFPLIQTAVLFGSLSLAAAHFIGRSPTEDLANLRSEVTYLELIFVNVLFIHLQTTLTLLSFSAGGGLNWSYMAIVAAIIVLIVPYYLLRRRILPK
jgi:hypothetical protein